MPENQESTSVPVETTSLEQEESSSEPSESSWEAQILVVYFPHTGNTKVLAEQISKLTGGTLAEIELTAHYVNLQEEAEGEINNNVRPEIIVNVENVEDYDVVFVGYPIWWDEARIMIVTFLKNYNFSRKTIVPFCTSANDKIDNSLHIYHELCPDATIAEGLTANYDQDIEP